MNFLFLFCLTASCSDHPQQLLELALKEYDRLHFAFPTSPPAELARSLIEAPVPWDHASAIVTAIVAAVGPGPSDRLVKRCFREAVAASKAARRADASGFHPASHCIGLVRKAMLGARGRERPLTHFLRVA